MKLSRSLTTRLERARKLSHSLANEPPRDKNNHTIIVIIERRFDSPPSVCAEKNVQQVLGEEGAISTIGEEPGISKNGRGVWNRPKKGMAFPKWHHLQYRISVLQWEDPVMYSYCRTRRKGITERNRSAQTLVSLIISLL
jgi:hypothetical protein